MVDPIPIILESKEEEGIVGPLLEVQAKRTKRVLNAHFWHTSIDIDEELEVVEEIGGMSTQLQTLKQSKISSTLLSELQSWNLG